MFFKPMMPLFEAEGGQGGGSAEPKAEPTTNDPINAEPAKAENMIPKSRFDEVNTKAKEMAERLAAYEKAEQDRAEQAKEQARKQAEEQGEFESLYKNLQTELESYKAYESRTKELEGLIDGMVKSKLESIPADYHDLIPSNLTAEQTLDWLNKAESKGLFGKQESSEPKEIGKPSNHSNQSPKVDKANLSALDKIRAGLGR